MAVDGPEVKNLFVAASLVLAKGDQIIGNVEMKCGKDLGGWPTVESIAEMRANGDFIILAVNSHATLTARAEQAEARVGKLEAALVTLECASRRLSENPHVPSINNVAECACDEARAALAK